MTRATEYRRRKLGMDHSRYQWSNLFSRRPIEWPGGASIALWVVVSAEWFEFDEQVRPVQSLGSPLVEYPDYWGYTLRDYGMRAGMKRVMDVLDERDLQVTIAVNSEICRRHPSIIAQAEALNWEFLGHGTTSSRVIYEQMPEIEERALINDSLSTIRSATRGSIRGWLSPSLSESTRTPDLLAAAGVEYICDWVNDDLPYRFETEVGTIHSLPYSHELSDLHVIQELHHTASDFRDNIVEQFRSLVGEAKRSGGRCMCIAIHPWLMGVPHRIRYLAEALDELRSDPSTWSATGSQILDVFVAQDDD